MQIPDVDPNGKVVRHKLTLFLTGSELAAVAALLSGDSPIMPEIADKVTPPLPSAPTGTTGPSSVPLPPPSATIPPAAGDNDEEDGDGDAIEPGPAGAPGETDVTGIPWDERIHASTKAKNADGSWRGKKGVDKALKAQIEAELKAAAPAPVPAAVTPPPPPPPVPVAAPPPPPPAPAATISPPPPPPAPVPAAALPPAPVAPVAAAPAPAPAPVAPPPVAEADGPIDFHGFMQKVSAMTMKRDDAGQQVVSIEYLEKVVPEISDAFIKAGHITEPLTNITDISGNQDMINYAVQLFQRDGKW